MGYASKLEEAIRGHKGYKFDNKKREVINQALRKAGFDGNGRFKSIGQALNVASGVLRKYGFEWGQVNSADLFRSPRGSTLIRLAKKDPDDPFSPTDVSNSGLSFSWEELSKNSFEVVAYLS
jgi:hypothetical protein